MRRRPVRGDDSGAVMVLALLVVTVFALVLAATLSFADTSVRTTVALRGQAADNYAADGAAEAAVNAVRKSTFDGTSGSCFGASNTLNLPNFYAGSSATVTCSTNPGSRVRIQCASLTNCNRPGTAVLALAQPGETGLQVKSNAGRFRVHGVVMSNSTIDITNGSLATNSGVFARGGAAGCTGPVTADEPPYAAKTCGESTGNALNVDPNYVLDSPTVPVHRKVPSCTGSVITFSPGYYDDAAALTAVTGGTTACKNKTWYFQPGSYYFDFHNGENAALAGTSRTWTISDGNVVAGTPTRSVSALGSLTAADFPGTCVSPIDSDTAVGVQFVFGGDSRMYLDRKVNAEFCGTYRLDKPPVAIYGMKTGAETITAVNGLKTTTTADNGQFVGVANIADPNNVSATWTKTGTNTQTGTVTVDGFSTPAGAIPAGSTLKSATLRVVHSNSAGATNDVRSVVVTPNGSTTALPAIPLAAPAGNVVASESLTLPLGALNSLSKAINDGTFTGVKVAYSATVRHEGVENVDSIQLDLTYAAPAYRAQTGCVVATPYPATGCAMLTTAQFPTTIFYIQGTTYAPRAALDISLNNATEQVFRFGVVARALKLFETGSVDFAGPVIEVPDDSPGLAFGVFLSTFVCPGSGPCPTSGTPDLTALVTFTDPISGPVAGAREVNVLSWSVPR